MSSAEILAAVAGEPKIGGLTRPDDFKEIEEGAVAIDGDVLSEGEDDIDAEKEDFHRSQQPISVGISVTSRVELPVEEPATKSVYVRAAMYCVLILLAIAVICGVVFAS